MMSYICTDSQGTLKTLGKYRFTSSLAMQGRSQKNITEEPRHPVLVPGHKGIIVNEIGDDFFLYISV